MSYIKSLNGPVITTKAQAHERILKKKRNVHEEIPFIIGISISFGGERLIKEMLLLFSDNIQDIATQQIALKVCILNSHLLTLYGESLSCGQYKCHPAVQNLQFFRSHNKVMEQMISEETSS